MTNVSSSRRDDNDDGNSDRIGKTATNKRNIRNTLAYTMSVLLVAAALTGGIYASAQTEDDDDGRSGTTSSPSSPPSTTSSSQNNSAATTTIADASSTNKTFYVFTDEVKDDFDDQDRAILQAHGFPAADDDDIDIYSLQTIVVNKGDLVTIHFFNLDDDDDDAERHSFTMASPYNLDEDLAGEESATITLRADTEGIFQYYSKHDLPQMTGQFVVLPSTGEERQSTNTATNSSELFTQ